MPLEQKYEAPKKIRIGRGPRTEKLYKAESARDKAIARAAVEWLDVMDHPPADYWTVAVPQQLYDLLSGWDTRAAYLAARAYLKLNPNPFTGVGLDLDPGE